MRINIFNSGSSSKDFAKAAPVVKRCVKSVLYSKKGSGAVNIVFTGEPEIKRLNRTFLKKSGSTDVIAFTHGRQKDSPACQDFGDIYICVPAAKKQAERMGHSLHTELVILAVHGALHLSGMDDSTPSKRRKMNRKTELSIKKALRSA